MKALILNSGLGHRMGVLTKEHPKCMTDIPVNETILSRQLKQIVKMGIKEVVITTGYYDNVLIEYCESLNLPLSYDFVLNPIYDKTNYIYSIYCAREFLANQDIVLMHGDLVFQFDVFKDILTADSSCMAVSSTIELTEKDFKAVVNNQQILRVGIDFFQNAVAAQPLYKLIAADWNIWLEKIIEYCESNDDKKRKCYAENAFNEISDSCYIKAFDVKDKLCAEIDTADDLSKVSKKLLLSADSVINL